ncbi:MAG: nuclear transport factor 2 family protein [Planctomycetota bacterium]
MRYQRRILAAALLCGMGWLMGAGAVESQEGGPHAADERAIRAAVEEYAKAFNRRDVNAIAAQCTDAVNYVDETGRIVRGRDALAKDFKRFFEENSSRKIQVQVESIQFIKPDVAVVDGTATLDPPVPGQPVGGRYTVVRVKEGGKWLVASVREMAEEIPSNYDRLKELEWLVGDWEDKDEASVVRSSVRWSENKNFLIWKFAVHAEGLKQIEGTQRIGWDPLRGQIRSWVFDSDGGMFEGFWVRDGNKWIVRVAGVLQDGTKSSATSTYTFVDNDTFTFQSRERVVGEEPAPDIDEVKVVRLPPTAE